MTEADDDGTWEVSGGVRVLIEPSAGWLAARAALPAPEPTAQQVAQQTWVDTVATVGAARVLRSAALGAGIADAHAELAAAAPEVADPAAQVVAQVVADAAVAANP